MWRAQTKGMTAALTSLALLLVLAIGGCGGGKVDSNSYSVKQGGKTVGSQLVKIEETSKAIVYAGTEKMPFSEFDTTFNRTLSVAKDLKSTTSYESTRVVPGASYATYMSPVTDGFSFLNNNLQSFEYVPVLPQGKSVIVLEPDSACLMQALLDRFMSAGGSSGTAFVVVPSRGAVVRQISIERRTQYQLHLTGQGLPDVDLAFDKSSFVTSVRTGDIMVQKGSAGNLTSQAFSPRTKASRIEAVKVATPEKLKNGDKLELAGNMYLPSGSKPFRGVILTGDAGPQDVTGAGFLSQVADSLAGQGFAVLVCARRGIPDSNGDYATHTRKTLLSDIDSQVDYMVNRGDVNRDAMALVGYGEGGLLASAAAVNNPYVKRVAMMATPAVTMFPDFVSLQIQQGVQQGTVLPQEAAFDQNVVNALVAMVNSVPDSTTQVAGHTVFLDWMRSWMPVTPPADLAAMKVPALVMQGTADTVVPASQAAGIMQALSTRAGGVQKLETFEGLGHSFGKDLTMAASVPNRQHPVVDAKVLDALGAWLKGQ
jgi:dienelactone hydrolase